MDTVDPRCLLLLKIATQTNSIIRTYETNRIFLLFDIIAYPIVLLRSFLQRR